MKKTALYTSSFIKKTALYASSAFLFIGLVAFFIWPKISASFEEAVYIALVGDMSSGSKAGEEMQNGVKLYLDKVNETGGVNGREIKLLVLNDRNDGKKAIEMASRIAENDNVLMVIGHDWSSTSIPAGRVYKKFGIPALTASAMAQNVTANNDWYFRTVTDTAFLGRYLAYYARRALKQKTVCLIREESQYGRELASFFEKATRLLELKIKRKWSYGSAEGKLDEEFEKIVSEIRSEDDPGMIFLLGSGLKIAQLITLLRRSGEKYPVFISDPLFPDAFDLFKKFPEEQSRPGYFSNGIYTVGYFIPDIANEKAAVFGKEYVDRYGSAPGWYGAYYHDAATVAIEAMRRAEIQGKGHIRRDRREIKKALEGMYNSETGIKGLRGYIYFDEKGASNGPTPIGRYQNNMLLSAFTQYQLQGEGAMEDDPIKKALAGEIIFIDNRMMNKKRVVYTGIDINEISALDQKKSTYYADFSLKFRYKGDFDNASDILFSNAVNPIKLEDHLTTQKKEGNIVTQVYHIKGYFKVDFDFKKYPLDRQTLEIKFRHQSLTRDKLIYIADHFGRPGPDSDALKLNHWRAINESFNEHIVSSAADQSGSDMFGSENVAYYSQCVVGMTMKKKFANVFFKVFFPLAILLLILYAVYFVEVDQFLIRMAIPLSVLMATAVYHGILWSHLGVEYMTALEYAYLTVYVIVALTLGMVLVINYFHKQGKTEKITFISYSGMITHSLMSVILFFWFAFG